MEINFLTLSIGTINILINYLSVAPSIVEEFVNPFIGKVVVSDKSVLFAAATV